MPGADCVFCAVVAGSERVARRARRARRDRRSSTTGPVFKGHVLVIPRVHVVTLPELPRRVARAAVRRGGRVAARAWSTALGAQGSWVAENNIVSQAVPHLHVHVVPRTKGDGLRGFFWPRQKYEGEAEMVEYATRLRAVLSLLTALTHANEVMM